MLKVEVVFVSSDKKMFHQELNLKEGATVHDALNQSALFNEFPEAKSFSRGIFSKKVADETLLKNGDRIEIYRELLIDPMEKRRQKAQKI